MDNIFTSKKLLWLAAGCILVLGALIFGPDKEIPEIDSGMQPHLGEWEVTDLTGFVNYKIEGGPNCEPVDKNYYPIVDNDKTFIRFFNGHSEPELNNIPRDVYDTLNVIEDVKGLFIFQFSFDNGYETNAALESFNVPYHHTKILKGSMWTFEVGLWTELEELSDKRPYVYGEIIAGNKRGGKNTVKVTGQFKSEDRIEGQWTWDGITAGPMNLPDCISESRGEGNWIAIRTTR